MDAIWLWIRPPAIINTANSTEVDRYVTEMVPPFSYFLLPLITFCPFFLLYALFTGRLSPGLFCCSGPGSCSQPAEEEMREVMVVVVMVVVVVVVVMVVVRLSENFEENTF